MYTYRVSLDCFIKKDDFWRPEGPPLTFASERRVLPHGIVLVRKARHIIRRGCMTDLTHMIDTTIQNPRLDEILVVQKFPEVFHEEPP